MQQVIFDNTPFFFIVALVIVTAIIVLTRRSGSEKNFKVDTKEEKQAEYESDVPCANDQAPEKKETIIAEVSRKEAALSLIRSATSKFLCYQLVKIEVENHLPEIMEYLGPLTLMKFEERFQRLSDTEFNDEVLVIDLLCDIVHLNICLGSIYEMQFILMNDTEFGKNDIFPRDVEPWDSISQKLEALGEARKLFLESESVPKDIINLSDHFGYTKSVEELNSENVVSIATAEPGLLESEYGLTEARESYKKALKRILRGSVKTQASAVRAFCSIFSTVRNDLGCLDNLVRFQECVDVEQKVNGMIDGEGLHLDGTSTNRKRDDPDFWQETSLWAELHRINRAWSIIEELKITCPQKRLQLRRIKKLMEPSVETISHPKAMSDASRIAKQGEKVISLWLSDVEPYLGYQWSFKHHYTAGIYGIKQGESIYGLDYDCPMDIEDRDVLFYRWDGTSGPSRQEGLDQLGVMFNAGAESRDWFRCAFAYIYALRFIDQCNEYQKRFDFAYAFEQKKHELAILHRRMKEHKEWEREMRELAFREQIVQGQHMVIEQLQSLNGQQAQMLKSQSFNNTLTGLSVAVSGLSYVESRRIRKALE